ncbi:unnamed protein product, partial [marine sediment metagenome]
SEEPCPICLEKFGDKRYGVHVEQEYEKFILLGHMDGKARHKSIAEAGLPLVFEAKTMSHFAFDRWYKEGFGGYQEYLGQISCYIEISGSKGTYYFVKNRSSGFRDKHVWGRHEIPKGADISFADNFQLILTKLESIEDWIAANYEAGSREGIYPSPTGFDPNSFTCKYCNFKSLCAPVIEDYNAVPEQVLTDAVADWNKGKQLQDEGEGLIDAAREVFLKQTKATGVDSWRTGNLAIRRSDVKDSVSYPKENLLKVFTEEELKECATIR